jgi:hypothetical protein
MYDITIVDAYSIPLTIPFELLTKEAFEEIDRALAPGGVVAINLISSVTGPGDRYFASVEKTLASVFPNVAVYQVEPRPLDRVQNLLILTSKTVPLPTVRTRVPGHSDELIPVAVPPHLDALVLTDEYAPVERLAKPIRDVLLYHSSTQ